MFRSFALFALCSAVIAVPSYAEDAKDSPAAPYVGDWQIAFPEGEGVIVNVPSASCDNPASITAVDETRISARTPEGDMGEWDVKSFGQNFPWWQTDPTTGQLTYSLVTRWVRDDAFILAGKDASGWKTDWDNAKQWTRCPIPE